jgi:hypothetical protein
VNHLELKTLLYVVDHLGKPWSELPDDARNFIELDLPRVARAWDQLSIEQHREALGSFVAALIEHLQCQIGFHEDDVEKMGRLRMELASAHGIIKKLRAPDSDSMSSDGSTAASIDLKTVPAGAPPVTIGPGLILSVPPAFTIQSTGGVRVQGTLQVSEPTTLETTTLQNGDPEAEGEGQERTTEGAIGSTAHAEAWLRGEMVRRAKVGEKKDRDTMVVALRHEYPHVGERKARSLFTALPAELKERRGPKISGRTSRKSSRT